jgi:4-amino-4-deoxy-L-arabinose transferase-like glycosyltransferase
LSIFSVVMPVRSTSSPPSSNPGALVFILLLALVSRIAVALWLPQRIIWADGERYCLVALRLFYGQGFGSLFDNSRSVPTQPLIIAAVFEVFGQNFLALRITFAVLGSLSCLVGYFIARQLFGAAVALLAGILLALYPYLVYLSALFEYPQTFFILVSGLFFLSLLQFRDVQRARAVLYAGVLLGIAVLSVPTLLLYVPVAALSVWWFATSRRLSRTLLLLVACSIPIGAWTVRNYVAYDRFMMINASGGYNFWISNNDAYYQHGKEGLWLLCSPGEDETKRCSGQKVDAPANVDLSPLVMEQERVAWKNGLAFVRESPARFLELTLRRFLVFWNPAPDALTTDQGSGGSVRNWVAAATYTPVLLLGALGLIWTRSRWRQLLPIYGYFLVLTGAHSVFLPATRYRLPLDFFLVIFAAQALHQLWLLLQSKRPHFRAAINS